MQGGGAILVGNNIALVLFGDVLEPCNFNRHPMFRISASVYAIAWTGLINMDGFCKDLRTSISASSRFSCPEVLSFEPIIIRDSPFAPKTIVNMANMNERAELHKTIWKIANDLRGSVDGWEFKAYVLGSIFYRFISENICDYIYQLMKDAGQPDFDYATIDDAMAENIRRKMVEEKGYFILPSQLFQNVVKTADRDENLNEHLTNIFRSIEASAVGTASEEDLRGLFSDFSVDSQALGSTVIKRNQLLAKVLYTVSQMELGSKYNDTDNDTFGDTYEFLMQMYASEAGKSGGEFFTPQQVSELLARLAAWNNPNINKVYDPACGSGSLLLKFAKTVGKQNPNLQYFGQEVNPTTYNLCRINMFLHNVNFDNFDIRLEDTLLKPQHMQDAPFDAIVSNPPYSLKWEGKDNSILINDERYAPAGVLAPKSAADLAFTMHMLWHLSEQGTAAIVEFPGVLYRGGDEKKIRQYLIKNNYVDTVIQLPANLFFGHCYLHHCAEEKCQDGCLSALHRCQQTFPEEW